MFTLKRALPCVVAVGLALGACTGGQTAVSPTTGPAPTSAPTSESAPTPVPSSEPVILRFGWLGEVDTLNPAYAFFSTSYTIFDLVYSSLVKEGLDGQYYGDLASSWSDSDDHLTWTFTLKEGLKWHNGEALKAEDLAWCINEIMGDPEGWATLVNYTNGFKEVTAPDDQTVQIVLEYPIPNMEYRVSFLYAFYRPDYEPLATLEDLQNFQNENLVGTGAFKLNKFDKDNAVVVLDANPDFYDGRPVIDGVIFQNFDNSDALVQALKVGDVDALTGVPNSAFATVKTFANVQAVNVAGRSFDELILNSASLDRDPAPTGHPALQDPQVRLAIAHAINKQDLVDIVFQGLARPEWSIVAPQLSAGFWHDPSLTDHEFDLEKANQILEDAGYVKGADGVREKDGERLELRLQYDVDSPEYARDADLIAGWLGEIGVKATPEGMDYNTLIERTTGIGDFDLVIWGWGGDPDPDFILSIMLCEQFEVGGWSDSGYCNAEYDQLYLDQQQAATPAERQQIIYRMQQLLFRDKPYIVLYDYDDLYAYRSDRFTNFQLDTPNPFIADTLALQDVQPVK
jgi:peptide/nickel transport system substrate-binding protein